MAFFQLCVLGAILISSCCCTEESTKLLLVQILLRHGDRAPTHMYPTDPNSEDDWPMGMGAITQLGKKQHYKIGQFLRSRYKDFVTSDPKEVYVNSSAFDRCLDSAAANLASFYAPEEDWKIDDDLDWQPIPIHYLPTQLDKYFSFGINCPRADEEFFKGLASKELMDVYEANQEMVEDVSNFSGLNYTEYANAFFLFDVLEIEKLYKLTIPEWAICYWEEMRHISNMVFPVFYNSDVILKLRIGPFLELTAKNLKNKINGVTPYLKVVVGSTHDINVAGVLLALNFTNMPRPPYGAALIIELHEMADASMAVRLLYLNATQPVDGCGEPHVLSLKGCSEFCPVDYFIESFQWLIPDDWEEECKVDVPESDED